MIKNYSQFHKVTLEGQEYMFDPYMFGIGQWTVVGRGTKVAPKDIQTKLNNLIFNQSELPSIMERYEMADENEKERLKDISLTWLTLKVRGVKTEKPVYGAKVTNTFEMGRLYFYIYDAKWKDKLPVWDRFPLTIPLQRTDDGFIGLNLHYLNRETRVQFADDLVSNFGVITEKSLKFALSYALLSEKMEGFESGIKRYLFSHVTSKILPIEQHELAYAVYMPVQEFKYNPIKQKVKKRG